MFLFNAFRWIKNLIPFSEILKYQLGRSDKNE
jgi:hypothetical protein